MWMGPVYDFLGLRVGFVQEKTTTEERKKAYQADITYLTAREAVFVALHAHKLLTRDVDNIVRTNRIELVDEFTGRIADRRRWPYGIQTALEAKEGLRVQPEGKICGSITIEHFINLYPKVSALTATAVPAAAEFIRFYGLATVVIPSHKPVQRIDGPDVVFSRRETRCSNNFYEYGRQRH